MQVIPTSSLSKINQSSVIDEINKNDSESDNCLENTEIPSMQGLSESILENPEFQDVLVQNINRMLESPDQNIRPQQNQNEIASEQTDQADRSYQHDIGTAVENIIKVAEQDPLFDTWFNELFNKTPKDNRKRKHSSVPTEKITEELISPACIPMRQPSSKSSKRYKPSKKTLSKRGVKDNQPEKAKERQDIPATVSEVFGVDTKSSMQTAQSQQFDPTVSTSKNEENLETLVRNSTINANQLSLEAEPILQSYASELKDEITEDVEPNYIETPKIAARLSVVKVTSMPFPARRSLIRAIDFNNEFPVKTENEQIDIYDTQETPSETLGMNCTIPSSTLPNLNYYSDTEIKPSTDTELNDTILKQEFSDISGLTHNINDGTVVMKLSTPYALNLPKFDRKPLSEHNSPIATSEATSQQQAKKSRRSAPVPLLTIVHGKTKLPIKPRAKEAKTQR